MPKPPSGSSERIVPCPSCGGRSVYGPSNPYRPFCCAACKGIDLGAWASDQYRIASKPAVDEDSGPEGQPPDPA